MSRIRNASLLLLGIALAAPPAQAGLFGGKDKETPAASISTNATRRYHLRIPDKTTEKELLQLFGGKAIVVDELRVIRRLVDEKRKEIAIVDKALLDEFAMKSESNYHYDPASKALYELIPKAGSTNAAALSSNTLSNYQQRLHFQFKTDDQIKSFTRGAIRKRYYGDALRMLAMLFSEKRDQLDRLDASLSEKFSMSRDREYEYDSKSMRLYEVVRAPQRGTMPKQSTDLPPLMR